MTTRLMKTSTRGPKKVVVQVLCPSCRGITRAQHVGHANVGGQRREVLLCLTKDCELLWVPGRSALPTAA